MRAHTAIDQHRKDGGRQLLVVLFLALPALFAFFCSIRLSYDSQYSGLGPWFLPSGFWFLYEASRTLGYIGIAGAVSITALAAIRQTVSETISLLMVSSILTAAILLWSAARAYQSPW